MKSRFTAMPDGTFVPSSGRSALVGAPVRATAVVTAAFLRIKELEAAHDTVVTMFRAGLIGNEWIHQSLKVQGDYRSYDTLAHAICENTCALDGLPDGAADLLREAQGNFQQKANAFRKSLLAAGIFASGVPGCARKGPKPRRASPARQTRIQGATA